MPRPLRRQPRAAPTGTSQATRQALKEKTNTVRTRAHVREPESSDGLVKTARPTRGRPQKPRQDEALPVMTGGLGSDDEPATGNGRQATVRDATKGRDAARVTQKTTARATRSMRTAGPKQAEAETVESDSVRNRASPRMAQPSSAQARHAGETLPPRCSPDQQIRKRHVEVTLEMSDFSLSPSPPGSQPEEPASASRISGAPRVQGTPAAVENSVSALRNFKRRPRQPSMLQMVQARRASAQPSILGETNVFGDAATIGSLEDDEDDFSPDAEGTPLHMGTAQQSIAAARTYTEAPASSQTRKRKSGRADSSSPASGSLRNKRQRVGSAQGSHEIMVPSTQPQVRGRSFPAQDDVDVQVVISSPLGESHSLLSPQTRQGAGETEEIVVSTGRDLEVLGETSQLDIPYDAAAPGTPDGTLADPMSSSSSPAQSRESASQQQNIMADPLTQITPPRTRPKRAPKAKPVSTSTLQTLLPKRRQTLHPRRRKTDYDLESSDVEIDEDEDELTAPSHRRRKTATSKPGNRPRPSKPAPKSRRAAPPKTREAPSARTYGRDGTSDKDKENDAGRVAADNAVDDEDFTPPPDEDSLLPEVSISMQDAALTSELAEAKRKFAAVDDWEMDFESVSLDGGEHRSSSSQMWR